MLRITAGDIWRGLIMAILAPVSVALFGVAGAVINAPDFDVFEVDFIALFKDLTNAFIIAAYAGGSGYILKNLLTDNDKNFLGIKTRN